MSMAVVSSQLAALSLPRSNDGCVAGLCTKSSAHVALRWSPLSASSMSSMPFRNGVYTHRGQRWRITCEATGRDREFESEAGRMSEEAKRKASDAAKAFTEKAEEVFNNAKKKVGEFQKNNDFQGKATRAAQAANRKLEEFSYDFRRNAAKLDREYGISEKAQQAVDYATEQMENMDRQLGARQKARNFTTDFRLKWPTYRRQFSNFLETPVGKSAATLFTLWFILSGWLFRILLVSMWVLPFAAPLLLNTLSKAAVVQGNCPNCGTRYLGGRNQVVQCSRCRGVVWQPRTDFSKDPTDPRIIDIDIDPK